MGLVFAVELLPVALLGIPSGAVVQRLGARTSMLVADLARAPLIALVPLLHALGGLSFGLLLAITAAHGLFSTAYFTCQRLILPGPEPARARMTRSISRLATMPLAWATRAAKR